MKTIILAFKKILRGVYKDGYVSTKRVCNTYAKMRVDNLFEQVLFHNYEIYDNGNILRQLRIHWREKGKIS